MTSALAIVTLGVVVEELVLTVATTAAMFDLLMDALAGVARAMLADIGVDVLAGVGVDVNVFAGERATSELATLGA